MFWNLVGVTAMFETADLLFVFGGDAVSLLLGSSWLAISRCQEQPHLQPGKMWDGMKSSSEPPSFA